MQPDVQTWKHVNMRKHVVGVGTIQIALLNRAFLKCSV